MKSYGERFGIYIYIYAIPVHQRGQDNTRGEREWAGTAYLDYTRMSTRQTCALY